MRKLIQNKAGSERGNIFDIKRYAIHDGPGIRTTVFLKVVLYNVYGVAILNLTK
jgi:hypothetical protein